MAKPTVHTSMRGVTINMSELRTKNESSVAVTGRGSHLRMNARGDTLADGGRVDRTREDIDAQYNTQLSGNAKRSDVRAVEADTFETPQQAVERMRSAQEAAKAIKPDVDFQSPAQALEASADTQKGAPKERTRRLSEKDD